MLDFVVFSPLLAESLGDVPLEAIQGTLPPPWQGLLAAVSAGIAEEVIFRLFLVSLFAWLGSLLFHEEDRRTKPIIMWISILFVAVVFGLSHLSATAAIGLPINAPVISRAIVLNGMGHRLWLVILEVGLRKCCRGTLYSGCSPARYLYRDCPLSAEPVPLSP